jgi:hypothetical protein
MDNPLRREFHLLTLLSGSRPTALKNVRIERIDFRQRLLSIPRPKGGEQKAFDIPQPRLMVRCIIRAIRLGRVMYPEQSKVWLFPADSETGHLPCGRPKYANGIGSPVLSTTRLVADTPSRGNSCPEPLSSDLVVNKPGFSETRQAARTIS